LFNDPSMQYRDIFEKAAGFLPYPYQERLATTNELPACLEIPTGAGKTAAVVLAWVWRRFLAPPEIRKRTPRRLVYCLPMRVLVEQTYNNVNKWLGNLEDYFKPRNPPQCFKLLGGQAEKDFVLYPENEAILIGTQDMLLSRALNRGYGSSPYRWPMEFGLINNDCLWVIDEVQLMGSGLATTVQLQAFRNLMGTAGESKTLWMSATINEDWLRTVDHNPSKIDTISIQDHDRSEPSLRKRLKAKKTVKPADSLMGESKKLAKEILDKHSPGERMIVVLNTVKRAVDLYKELKSKNNDEIEITLLHSHFRTKDREEALKRALMEPGEKGSIVVSTQVIEAGVDISSAVLFTELAPWSSLVQRFGRCNRKGEYQEEGAEIYWIDVNDPEKITSGEALPYTEYDLKKSRGILSGLTDAGPDSLSDLNIIRVYLLSVKDSCRRFQAFCV